MAAKLWEKNVQMTAEIERFTVGRDREMDLYLAKHDVLGSMAHTTMLETIGLLTAQELEQILAELKNIYATAERGEFVIEDGVEDVHSQVELMLTRRLGDVGKKIHSGRSRNDQVALDQRLYLVDEALDVIELLDELGSRLWVFFPVEPHTHHPAAGLRQHELQCGLCTDGSWKDGAQRGLCPGFHRWHYRQAGLRCLYVQFPELRLRETPSRLHHGLQHHASQEEPRRV